MTQVLLVDDELMNRKVASKILKKEGFEVVEAVDGLEALERLKTYDIDIILMDLMMPNMDGYEATKIIKEDENLSSIPIIILSALSDKSAILKGLELGANEYLTKPYDIAEFKLRVHNANKLRSFYKMSKDNEAYLAKEVDEKTKALQEALREVENSEKDIVSILAKVGEYRDNETSMHTIRVGEISALLAKEFGYSDDEVELVRLSAPMHDIGKIGIEDAILLKNGKLTAEEFEVMKTHASIGATILSLKQTPLLSFASQIAESHHEKYNGKGYPKGLSGEDIPLVARIVAVVDVFDALMSKRPYKEPFSLEKTLSIIEGDSGTHFDPKVVEKFLENLEKIVKIRERLDD